MPTPVPFQAPPLALLATEPLRAALEFCAAHLAIPDESLGDGHPVIVYPGLAAGSLHTSHLRNFLRGSGFTVYDWALGVNVGPDDSFENWLAPLVERVRELFLLHGRKVSLVGWSLGGLYAREIAKCVPECVRQVVTLATPFGAVADANHAGTLIKWMGGDWSQFTPDMLDRLREEPPVPTTSIYSESDGVVCWRGCLAAEGPLAENVRVEASHLGMATHPQVLRVVADRLAQPERRRRACRSRLLRPPTGPSRSRQ